MPIARAAPIAFQLLTVSAFVIAAHASFLNPDKFEIVEKDAAPQFTVALNRWNYIALLNKPWLMSIRRGNLILAAVAPTEGSAPQPSTAGPP